MFDANEYPIYVQNEESKPYGEGCRNVATAVLAQMLGCERVVTQTRFFVHDNKLGILMDLETGTPVNAGTLWRQDISKTTMGKLLLENREMLSSPKDMDGTIRKAQCQLMGLPEIRFFQRVPDGKWYVEANYASNVNIGQDRLERNGSIKERASEAEIMDIISRQADRHSTNYVVDLNKSSLKLIDNDISFGPESRSAIRRFMKNQRVECILPDFPERISEKLFDALNKLTGQAFKERLKGLISETEINQTITSWEEVKAHYSKHPKKILKQDGDWNSAPFGGYLKRDAMHFKKK